MFGTKEIRENWLCRHCEHYKGMDAETGGTRCGNYASAKYFEYNKDYLVHYASGRPRWCMVPVNY